MHHISLRTNSKMQNPQYISRFIESDNSFFIMSHLFLRCLILSSSCSPTHNFGTIRTTFRKTKTTKKMIRYFCVPLEENTNMILFPMTLVATWIVPSRCDKRGRISHVDSLDELPVGSSLRRLRTFAKKGSRKDRENNALCVFTF